MTLAASPALRLLLHRRARLGKEVTARLPERRGIETTPRPAGKLVWLHAASVGETMSVLPLLAELIRLAPSAHVLLTTGTTTSAQLLAVRLPALRLHSHVTHRFVPLDVRIWTTRFLGHWRPDVAGFVESELWPNLLAGCRRRRIPVVLINARLSARSFTRWRRARSMIAPMIDAVTEVQAQSELDADRFRALGARRVSVPGNLKVAAPALPVDAAELARLRPLFTGRPAWVAASTHPGEEEAVFAVHRALASRHAGLLTILVPRHPERGADLLDAARRAGLPAARRSLGDGPPEAGIWIADTLAELGLWYRLAPIAFVGRSLLPPGGGQNPLEPARLSCAVAVGPHTGNFPDAVAVLRQAGALHEAADAAGLTDWVDAMLLDPDRRAAMGKAGAAAVARHGGLPARLARRLIELADAGPEAA